MTPYRVILAALSIASAPAVWAADAHVHGQAHLDVAIDGGTVTLMLESPTDSLTGFEHPPRNAAEHAAVAKMKTTLEHADGVFRFDPAAACRQTRVSLASLLLGSPPEPGHEGHADLDGEFVFQCAHPEQLHGMDVRLADAFPRMKKILVEIAGPRGQKAVTLGAGQTRVDW